MTHSTDNEERAIAQYEAARDLEADDPVTWRGVMSKYSMGVDIGYDSDYSAYTVVRGLRWYDKLLRKLRLSKATWTVKIVDSWTEPPTHPSKTNDGGNHGDSK